MGFSGRVRIVGELLEHADRVAAGDNQQKRHDSRREDRRDNESGQHAHHNVEKFGLTEGEVEILTRPAIAEQNDAVNGDGDGRQGDRLQDEICDVERQNSFHNKCDRERIGQPAKRLTVDLHDVRAQSDLGDEQRNDREPSQPENREAVPKRKADRAPRNAEHRQLIHCLVPPRPPARAQSGIRSDATVKGVQAPRCG